jgi:hypothetical protein
MKIKTYSTKIRIDLASGNHSQHGMQSTSSCHSLKEPCKNVIGIFIDLSKAFDAIDHQILLKNLKDISHGIWGVANSLINSYLCSRVLFTHVLGEKSNVLKTQYGVPEGSVLAPPILIMHDTSRIQIVCTRTICR